MKSVTVVLSTYNGALHIERQLDSIFAQSGVLVKVVIRDDNSKDNTLQIIENYIKRYPTRDIKLIKGENLGFAKSFFVALASCDETEFYAFSDQDDVWKKEKLIKCIGAIHDDESIPQLSYCRMYRSDIDLNLLDEQVDVLVPEALTKKITLTKTFNYGAATVINKAAKNLVCRTWPEIKDLPHDMWVGLLCFWFGKVYYVDEPLYYWIRYNTSVTGEGTKKTGCIYRVKKSLNGQSYINVAPVLLEHYGDLLTKEDAIFLKKITDYKKQMSDKISLLFDAEFKRDSILGTIVLKMGILLGWY